MSTPPPIQHERVPGKPGLHCTSALPVQPCVITLTIPQQEALLSIALQLGIREPKTGKRTRRGLIGALMRQIANGEISLYWTRDQDEA